MRLRLFALLLLLCTLLVPSPAPLQAQQRTNAFVPAPCMFDLPGGEATAELFECGYLTVPARHSEPNGPTIELAVAILKSSGASPARDPLFMMQGGPGGSTIDIYSQLLLLSQSPRIVELRQGRDIVLFDQRGTLHSRPSLLCRELWELTEQTLEQRLTVEESQRLTLEATDNCRARLLSEGVDLPAFNSIENADDVEALRVALGYDQINLYGVSYGTLLAQHVMRRHPENLRSVILDAVVPTNVNFNTEVAVTINRAFGELFGACAADPNCNAAYPNLEQVFFDTVDALNATPARVPLTDPETQRSYNAVIDGEIFYSLIFQLLYATEFLPALPNVIYAARDNNFDVLARTAIPLIVFDRTLAIGMYNSTTCAEDADFAVADVEVEGVRPEVAEEARRTAEFLLESCALWNVPPLEPEVDAPVTSDIPTLLLSGRFDPVTPAAFAEEVARGLPNSFAFEFADVGHGALTAGDCPAGVALQFLANPTAAPDGSCTAQTIGPRFITPATVLLTPTPSRAIAALEPENLWQLAALAGLLIVLLSPVLIWPLAALFGRRGQHRRSPAGWLGRLLALLAALVALVFVIGLVVVVGSGIFQNDLTVFFGVPREAAWLFTLPVASLALAIGMLVCAVLSWQGRFWSGLNRVYYLLLTLAAFGYVGLLGLWGALPF